MVRVEAVHGLSVIRGRCASVSFEYAAWERPDVEGQVTLQTRMYLIDGYKLRPQVVRPDRKQRLDNQSGLGRPGAAVTVSSAHNIDFVGCRFENLASTGLDYVWGTQGGVIEDCLFTNIGGNAIVVGSFSPMAHETHLPYDPSDQREVCSNLTICNNIIRDVTNEDWGTVGILAGYVKGIHIEHNEISDVSYSGISLGWGWTSSVNCMRNNEVHRNHIYNYGKHMYDVAGIYTLGAQPKTFITENAIHSIYAPIYVHDPNHWFYLYTDEGSAFITVKDNWTEAEKFLQNANGPCNNWVNNGPAVNDTIKINAGLKKPLPAYQKK